MPRLTEEEQKKGYVRPTPVPIPPSQPQPLVAGQPTRVDVGRATPLLAARYAIEVPAGYVIEKVEPTTVETVGTGRTPYQAPAVQVTFKEKPKPLGLAESAYVTTRVFQQAILTKMGRAEDKALATFLEVGPLSQIYFATGAVGAWEADILGVASLGTSIYESVRTGQLQYKPALDIKTSPTVIGASVGALFGAPQEAREWEERPLTYKWGTIFGEASYIVLSSEAMSRLWVKIRGVKVTKLAGATEKELIATGEYWEVGKRTTELSLQTERVPSSYAAYLREMQRYFQPKTIEFGGTQASLIRTADEISLIGEAYTGIREAAPYISATKYAVAQKPGILKTIGIKLGLVKAQPIVVTEFGALKSEVPYLLSKAVYTERTITAIQVFGEIDKQIFIDLAKSVPPSVAQSFYAQMGGVAPQILVKVPSPTIPIMTRVVGYSIPTGTGAFALGAATTVIPKAFVKKTITTPQIIIPTVSRQIISLPKLTPAITQPITPSFVVTPKTQPFTMPKVAPIVSAKQAVKAVTTQTAIAKTIHDVPTPTIPKVALPYVPFGGGEAGRRSFESLFGKWYPRKHPVKPWEKMLGTFGVKAPGGAVKLGKMEVPKLGAAAKGVKGFGGLKVSKSFKAFGFTVSKRRRRRR